MFVRNVEGHFKVPEGYDSWLDWWRDNAPEGHKATESQNHDCDVSDNLVGAHVYYDKFPDEIYVVPLCKPYNNYHNGDRMLIDDPICLVRVSDSLLVKE
ncbi:MAG: hypothetical protein J5965_24895 [Aeriscardovia sp.]|nr:hypothetical protein [Aeriscardovia sp.]